MKIGLIVNTQKTKAVSCAADIINLFRSAGAGIVTLRRYDAFLDTDGLTLCDTHAQLFDLCDAAVTVGGDGTIIHAAKHAARAEVPLIGVNVGRLGFAAEVEPDNISDLLRLLSGEYRVRDRMLLDVSVRRGGGVESYLAVNDATVARGQFARIVDISVSLDNSPISTYRADGLLFSTPTGSTAYSLSAGGPVIYPEMKCILLTPVCPHSLISRSVVFDGDAVLEAVVHPSDDIPAGLSVDGETNIELSAGDVVTVKRSPLKLRLINLYDRNFYQLLNEKLKERKS